MVGCPDEGGDRAAGSARGDEQRLRPTAAGPPMTGKDLRSGAPPRAPAPAASRVYEFTPNGADLEPIIQVLGRWGARSPGHRPDLPLSATSFVLSMRTNVDATRTADLSGSWGLRVGDFELHAQVVEGTFTVDPGSAPSPDAGLSGAPEALAGLVYGGRQLADAVPAGDVALTADHAAAER